MLYFKLLETENQISFLFPSLQPQMSDLTWRSLVPVSGIDFLGFPCIGLIWPGNATVVDLAPGDCDLAPFPLSSLLCVSLNSF